MKLTEFCDVVGVELRLTRYANQNGRWSAAFDNCEVKAGSMLISAYGNGVTPKEAMEEYIRQVEGKTIVVAAMSPDHRRMFVVPGGLEA